MLVQIQLIEALKNECYICSPLTEFLLERALNCKFFGNYFYWYLYSESKSPEVQVRMSIIMEVFLLNSIPQVSVIYKQHKCIQKLQTACQMAKNHEEKFIKKYLKDNGDCFWDLTNPINPLEKSRSIDVEKLKIMKSKMKPLIVYLPNSDIFGHPLSLIFKNGDDLRQDMFALNLLKIMDLIWKFNNYDFRMNIYKCMTMGENVGIIEAVDAVTMGQIQRKVGTSFRLVLREWLESHNETPLAMKHATEEFTLSTIGYCVATYILGVADRHFDNIMIRKSGQIFHIDFGHILGNFKSKFGISRERVPFILTKDFQDVINEGIPNEKSQNFNSFKTKCLVVGI